MRMTDRTAPPPSGSGLPSRARWTALCAAAETVGMAAAAAAAETADVLIGEPARTAQVVVVVSLVVAGGLVEGTALGVAQSAGLRRLLPRRDRRLWVLVTVLVAGLGWAGASAPAALSSGPTGAPPPLLLLLAGAVGIGVTMGALLGAAQAVLLRGRVRHPWRWVAVNAAAWPPAMAVIFLGAGTPDGDWSWSGVVALGAATGLVAGTVLGLVSGRLMPVLLDPGTAPTARASRGRLRPGAAAARRRRTPAAAPGRRQGRRGLSRSAR
jgi:hypothetical protein